MLSLVDTPAPAAPIVDASILAAARADNAAPAAPSPAAVAPAGLDHAGAAASLVEFAAITCFPLWPSLAAVYPKATRDAIAAALGPVLKKYNIDLNALPPELVLAMVVFPTLPAAIAAVRADRAARSKPPMKAPVTANEEKTPSPTEIKKDRSPLDRFPGLNRTETGAGA